MIDFPFPVSEAVRIWLYENGFGSIDHCELIGSGHHECYLLSGADDKKIVAKITDLPVNSNGDNSNNALVAEANGLALIAETKSIRTPEVLYLGAQCLLLEYIADSSQQTHYWRKLATGLANLHRYTAKSRSNLSAPFGLNQNNYCGSIEQVNGWFEDGHEFFAKQRLLHQVHLAYDNGYLESPWVISVESICERLTELIPWQSASLLHGDLWPGNILIDEHGEPALIDPAVYYGWREADIAMSLLFGGLPHEFYVAYEDAWPLEQGWRERVPLYNLYHLLNHLNIFGTSYLPQVQETISRYA